MTYTVIFGHCPYIKVFKNQKYSWVLQSFIAESKWININI